MGSEQSTLVCSGIPIRLLSQVAEGSYANVYRACGIKGGKEYAVKRIAAQDSVDAQLAKQEITVHQLMGDQVGVARFLGQREREPFSEFEALSMMESLCGTLQALHSRGFVHRDLKPNNLMFQNAADLLRPVLIDLGSCQPIRLEVTSRQQALMVQEEATAHSAGPYRPPELWDVKSQCVLDGKTDVWAVGCLLFYLAAGGSPFEDEEGQLKTLHARTGTFTFPDNFRFSARYRGSSFCKGRLWNEPWPRLVKCTAANMLQRKVRLRIPDGPTSGFVNLTWLFGGQNPLPLSDPNPLAMASTITSTQAMATNSNLSPPSDKMAIDKDKTAIGSVPDNNNPAQAVTGNGGERVTAAGSAPSAQSQGQYRHNPRPHCPSQRLGNFKLASPVLVSVSVQLYVSKI
eukprot:g7929.t1